MEKIFEQAKDLHVVATVVYGNGTDEYAYVDSACTTKFKASELKEAFIKGAIINVSDELFAPVSFGEAGISYVTVGESNAVAVATLAAEADAE